ncbi:sigma-54 dependent transcriptional regulator [Fulvivirga ulvae]|uniref:sigma-54-dependent transcriptional regulator n=1 Tax=Fulvivirga ulvae TaxID=2904245 RepID=UPI001F35E823|nr:sigma-54 dependent transcriptional regulator [Fulvivirga ulvae]UII31010.1 sigma-54 dependent transcriptional regulator [Fulvivirga ulvae]
MIKTFVVDDDPVYAMMIGETLKKHELLEFEFFTNAEDCLTNLNQSPDIITIDFHLPDANGLELLERIRKVDSGIYTVLISGQKQLEVVVEAYKQGASSYLIKNEDTLVELDNTVKNLISAIRLKQEVESLREQVFEKNKYSNILGSSSAIMKVLKMVQKVESKNILVMITGESGTGKELFASAIHYNSPRRKKPFVTVNMGAIPHDLVESELFGHEKGAFTGASSKRIGKFEEAHQGTIFLDEIGEIDLDMQKKLLRVLQEQEVVRLGSNKAIKLDVRVIAATNKDLVKEVKEGRFREDLFYRLQGFLLQLPPLRDRGDDVIIMAKAFLREFLTQNKMDDMRISRGAMEQLMKHNWPGNVRELKSIIERAALMADGDEIQEEDLIFST